MEKTATPVNCSEIEPKRRKIIEKICYEDLGQPIVDAKDLEDLNKVSTVKKSQQVSLAKVERYLHGPVPINQYDIPEDPHFFEEIQLRLNLSTQTWLQRTPQRLLVTSTAAVNALGELSPGGALMRGFQEQSAARK